MEIGVVVYYETTLYSNVKFSLGLCPLSATETMDCHPFTNDKFFVWKKVRYIFGGISTQADEEILSDSSGF